MATLSINIPDAIAPRLRDAFALATHYPDTMPNPAFNPELPVQEGNMEFIPNTMTKMAWAKEQIIEFIKQKVREGEMREYDTTQRSARIAHAQSIDAAMNLT